MHEHEVQQLLIREVTVLDTVDGAVADSLLIDGDRIADLGHLRESRGAVECSLDGSFVSPGFIDVHVHLTIAGPRPVPIDIAVSRQRAALNCEHVVATGVTAVRDLGGVPEVAVGLARHGALHSVRPTITAANHYLRSARCPDHANPYHDTTFFRDDREARAAVRADVAAGASWIKVTLHGEAGWVEVTEEELVAIVEESRQLGARVACHAVVRDAIALAVHCGVDTIEHGRELDPTLAAAMADRGAVLVPTASRLIAPWIEDSATRAKEEQQSALRAAVAAGVTVAVGSDRQAGTPIDGYFSELSSLQELGLPADEVWRAACQGGAAVVGDREMGGRVVIGGCADLVILRTDPRARVPRRDDVVGVIVGGRVVHAADQSLVRRGMHIQEGIL